MYLLFCLYLFIYNVFYIQLFVVTINFMLLICAICANRRRGAYRAVVSPDLSRTPDGEEGQLLDGIQTDSRVFFFFFLG